MLGPMSEFFTPADTASNPTGNPADAVVLLSGGLDSATCLAIAHERGMRAHCLSFDYGQRHRFELEASERIARELGAESYQRVTIDLRVFGGSALTSDIEVPKDDEGDLAIPLTYVPARNTIFLSYALALAEVRDARAIFIGVNAIDYSGYPDCRPDYIEAYQRMCDLATRAGVEGHGPTIETPLLHMTKQEIIELGTELGVDYSRTHSCYDPESDGMPCLRCDACRIRVRAFEALGMRDPLIERYERERSTSR